MHQEARALPSPECLANMCWVWAEGRRLGSSLCGHSPTVLWGHPKKQKDFLETAGLAHVGSERHRDTFFFFFNARWHALTQKNLPRPGSSYPVFPRRNSRRLWQGSERWPRMRSRTSLRDVKGAWGHVLDWAGLRGIPDLDVSVHVCIFPESYSMWGSFTALPPPTHTHTHTPPARFSGSQPSPLYGSPGSY